MLTSCSWLKANMAIDWCWLIRTSARPIPKYRSRYIITRHPKHRTAPSPTLCYEPPSKRLHTLHIDPIIRSRNANTSKERTMVPPNLSYALHYARAMYNVLYGTLTFKSERCILHLPHEQDGRVWRFSVRTGDEGCESPIRDLAVEGPNKGWRCADYRGDGRRVTPREMPWIDYTLILQIAHSTIFPAPLKVQKHPCLLSTRPRVYNP
jgi:hypothetical protein